MNSFDLRTLSRLIKHSGSNMKSKKYTRIQSYCCDSTALMPTAMWHAWDGPICTAMSRRSTTGSCGTYAIKSSSWPCAEPRYSNLCTRNKKVFTHEHELFTYSELRKHERFGDDHPGAVDQSGFRGHPECGFCRQRFYGDDELYTHCREKHERCHICDRRNQGRQQQYLVDYAALEQHFRQDHFLCPDQECLDKKFVVFESEMDLKAHQLEAHPNGLSKDARKEARRVDMSGFDYRSPHARGGRSDRPGNRGQGGGGRGRDPNAEPLPASSAQPLGRAELAFQRQLAIQSAQSTSARTFGAHLTSSAAPFATRPNDAANQAGTRATAPGSRTQISHDNGYPSIGSLSLGGHSDPTPTQPSSSARDQALSPQEQARRARHAAVMERALKLLRHDQTPFDEFRAKVSSFQRSSISASELVEFFYTLFDTSLADLGKLINELADIYENPSKRTALLQAWNDWKATREDYPALPGPSGAAASLSSSSSSLGSGGTRVLRLKSSTAQSSRSAVNRQGSWGSSQTGSEPFPAMASSSQASRAGPTNAPFWASSLGSSTAAAPAPPRPSNAANARSHAIASAEAFPALPAAAKPATTIFGYGTGAVRRDVGRGAPSTNAWAASSSSSSADAAAAAAEQEEGGKKKGKANKKQMLFHFG